MPQRTPESDRNIATTTDGIVVLRAPRSGDPELLIAERDGDFYRWMGHDSAEPWPAACIVVDEKVVGWVDYDTERDWLQSGEVNLGYNIFRPYRGHGYATRSVQLFMHHLALRTIYRTATLLIDPENVRSLAVAARTRFVPAGGIRGSEYFTRPVPPLTYGDGVVTIRCQREEDVDADLAAKDDEQIDWLWLPGQREAWRVMTPHAQRAQVLAWVTGQS